MSMPVPGGRLGVLAEVNMIFVPSNPPLPWPTSWDKEQGPEQPGPVKVPLLWPDHAPTSVVRTKDPDASPVRVAKSIFSSTTTLNVPLMSPLTCPKTVRPRTWKTFWSSIQRLSKVGVWGGVKSVNVTGVIVATALA